MFEPAFYDCWTRNKTFRWKLLYFVHCIYTKRPLSENGNKKTRVMKHIFVSFTNFDHLGANHRLCSGCDVYLHWSSTYTAPDLFIRKSEEYCIFFSPLPTNSRLKLLTYYFLKYSIFVVKIGFGHEFVKPQFNFDFLISICLRMVNFYWYAAPVQKVTNWPWHLHYNDNSTRLSSWLIHALGQNDKNLTSSLHRRLQIAINWERCLQLI